MNSKRLQLSVGVIACGLIAGCAVYPPAGPVARAEIKAASGSQVAGMAVFSQGIDGVKLVAKLTGLSAGEHGFHVHEVGDCSAADATSAKGHFNPHGNRHGHVMAEHHVGDLPNLRADSSGLAEYQEHIAGLSLVDAKTSIVGRAVVIHADADDYATQPAGNSGKRVGCGVIVLDAAK
ncbi:MAG TPA: superoxide dismutase family protein [Rhodocyclaceae bacterium]|nr:superoxide dismutase family protein [Rhodocyclaceae bacterium]